MCCPAGVQKASFVVPSCAAADITSSYSNLLPHPASPQEEDDGHQPHLML